MRFKDRLKASPYLRSVLVELNGKCFYCHRQMILPTLEHVIPKSKSKYKGLRNTVLSCYECNHDKLDRMPTEDELLKFKKFKEIVLHVKKKTTNKRFLLLYEQCIFN